MGTFDTIAAGDGSARVYLAGTGSGETQGVLVLHPWWGLNDDVIAYADRLAAAGFTVAAPDLFDGQIATTVEGAEGLAHGADEGAVNAIVLAALDRLTERARRVSHDRRPRLLVRRALGDLEPDAVRSRRRDRPVLRHDRRQPGRVDSPRPGPFRRGRPVRVGGLGRRVRVDPPIRRSRRRVPPLPEHRPLVRRTVARRLPTRSGGPRLRANRRVPAGTSWRGRAGRLSPRPGPVAGPRLNRRRASPGTRPGALRRRLEARAWSRRSCTWSPHPSPRRTGSPARRHRPATCMPSASPRAARS